MMIDYDADVDMALADAGVMVTFGAQSTHGLIENTETSTLDVTTGLTLLQRTTTLYIREGSLAGLVEDAAITVDGVNYRIRNPGTGVGDGRLKPVEVVPA
jgi:hypothetical protein